MKASKAIQIQRRVEAQQRLTTGAVVLASGIFLNAVAMQVTLQGRWLLTVVGLALSVVGIILMGLGLSLLAQTAAVPIAAKKKANGRR